MADGTRIEWTDATWNIITGCDVVSPGCTNCYAMQLAGTRLRNIPSRKGLTKSVNGRHVWTGEVRFNAEWLTQPLRWRRPRQIFVAAHGDLFDPLVLDRWLDKIFAVMALAPHHTFQILTKRPERMRAYLGECSAPLGRQTEVRAAIVEIAGGRDAPGVTAAWLRVSGAGVFFSPLPNVWLGVSVEDQKRADERIPLLLATPAAVRWISAEPLLGPIDLTRVEDSEFSDRSRCWTDVLRGHEITADRNLNVSNITGIGGEHQSMGNRRLDWVVAGGESGSHARPMHPDWARQLRDQCAAAGVAFHFKQWGAWGPDLGPEPDGSDPIAEGSVRAALWDGDHWDQHEDAHAVPLHLVKRADDVVYRLGKKRTGRTLDGEIHDAWPEAAGG